MFETEAQLCEAFIADARGDGWQIYPEHKGWDILIVRNGVQIGIQAKLRDDVYALEQALPRLAVHPDEYRWEGPHYRAVLIGRWQGRTPEARQRRAYQFRKLAARLHLIVLEPVQHGGVISSRWYRPGYYAGGNGLIAAPATTFGGWRPNLRWYRWAGSRLWVPDFEPEIPAGVPCPKVIGAWQVAAVKLERLAGAKGYVTIADSRAVRAEVRGHWRAGSMLRSFFVCTRLRVDGAMCGWTLRKGAEPSKYWPEAARTRSLATVAED